MPPLISVFTAACDIGTGIERPFRSLLDQTHPEWEWVVVDDSRGPETAELLAKLAVSGAAGGRVRVERPVEAPWGSIGVTKRRACALAHGEVLVELDHDDELTPDALATVAGVFARRPPVDFVYSDFVDLVDTPGAAPVPATYPLGWGFGFGAYATEIVGGRRVIVGLAPPVTWETIRHIVAAPNHLRAWRTDFYRRIGGHDRDLPVADDYELVVRSFLRGEVARIPRPLYLQYHHADGRNASRRRNDEIQRLVGEVAARSEHALDRRCLEYGLVPSLVTGSPWTSPAPILTGNRVIDPVVDAADAAGQPLVSVVVPTYDRPALLERAIASVLDQTYRNVEVLVVGDHCPSVDAVVAGIHDRRVRHWNLAERTGDGTVPRNYAAKAMARGTFVAYLDDDNEWYRDHLESLMELLLEDRSATFAFSSFELAGEPITCVRPRRFQIDSSALVHHRFLLECHGYWRRLADTDGAPDWELVSRWSTEVWHASRRPTLRYNLETSSQSEAAIEFLRWVAAEEARGAREGAGDG